jgi:2-keto-3-deoxy-galactonokinase
LSGLLIGDELRSSPFLRDRSASKVVLAASGALLASYRTALDALSIPHDVAGESDLNIAAAHRSLDARIDRR